MNHRLNAFGYLYLGDLMGPEYAASGNVGMLDLVAVLEWVRDNIAAFGGDPGNVTIMGQSGGGAKVSILMAMPAAKGLFHKASIQSGPGLKVGRKTGASATAKAILADLGVAPGDIKALQGVPAQALVAAAAKHPGGFGNSGLSPIVDDNLPRDPFDPDASPLNADVPILIGCVKDEMTIFTASEPWFGTMTEADLTNRAKTLGPKGAEVIDVVRKLHPTYTPTYLYTAAISAQFAFANSIRLAERKAAQHGGPAYFWYLTWETPAGGGVFKTPHTMEIPFMMYSYDKVRTFVGEGPAPKRMADQIAGAWVAFARTGKPDGPLTPPWPAYDAEKRATMVFDLKSTVVEDPYADLRKVLMS
jgi:para-nitrobenzyl esterase